MDNVGDSFAWAFRDPNWASKMLLQGLIAIIPIIGWIAMTGWMMMAFENARAGRNELPPAGFHLERGIAIFVIFLIYGIVLGLPGGVLISIGAVASNNAGDNFNGGSPLIAVGYLVAIAGSLFFRFLIPSLIVNTYHRGIGGGMDLERVWWTASVNVTNSVIAGLIIFVSSFIGGLGFACCIGFVFTIPWENTINAGAAAWFERQQTRPVLPPAQAA